jgi:hypothetical protein
LRQAKSALHSSQNQLQELDQLIRRGQQGAAREILLAANLKKIPRAQIAAYADLARRLNMPKVMLLLLKPIVRREAALEAPPSIQESALFATALSRLGVFPEAQNILKKLDDRENSEVLLFTAQNLMLQWDYLGAIPKLKKYVLRKDLTPYQKWVGQVNLASSLIGEMQWKNADAILDSLKNEIEQTALQKKEEVESVALLHANALGLMAHSAFLQGDLEKARRAVNESTRLLSGSQSRYELLAKKWQAIVELFQNPDKPAQLQSFRALKAESIKARDWETTRDFDFYEALSRRDDALFLRLYHGTPHTSFRKRIKKIYQPTLQIPKMVDWKLAASESESHKDLRIFDVSKGCEIGGRANLTKQPMLSRLLQFLTKDFYRPAAMGSVFSALYPDEKFNPVTSPNRTYMVAKRLRKWFESQNIPLGIEIENEWFRLKAEKPYILRVSFQNFNVSKNEALLESIQRYFGDQKFSRDQLIQEMGFPQGQAQKFITWAMARRKMRQWGSGKSSRFTLVSKSLESPLKE